MHCRKVLLQFSAHDMHWFLTLQQTLRAVCLNLAANNLSLPTQKKTYQNHGRFGVEFGCRNHKHVCVPIAWDTTQTAQSLLVLAKKC